MSKTPLLSDWFDGVTKSRPTSPPGTSSPFLGHSRILISPATTSRPPSVVKSGGVECRSTRLVVDRLPTLAVLSGRRRDSLARGKRGCNSAALSGVSVGFRPSYFPAALARRAAEGGYPYIRPHVPKRPHPPRCQLPYSATQCARAATRRATDLKASALKLPLGCRSRVSLAAFPPVAISVLMCHVQMEALHRNSAKLASSIGFVVVPAGIEPATFRV